MTHWWNETEKGSFDVLLNLHLSITLVNDQIGAQLFYFIICLLQSSTCFEQRFPLDLHTGRPITQ